MVSEDQGGSLADKVMRKRKRMADGGDPADMPDDSAFEPGMGNANARSLAEAATDAPSDLKAPVNAGPQNDYYATPSGLGNAVIDTATLGAAPMAKAAVEGAQGLGEVGAIGKNINQGLTKTVTTSKYAIPEVMAAVEKAPEQSVRQIANDPVAYKALLDKFPELRDDPDMAETVAQHLLDNTTQQKVSGPIINSKISPQEGNVKLGPKAQDTLQAIKDKDLSFFDPEQFEGVYTKKTSEGDPIGSLGLDSSNRTQSIKVDPAYRGQGIAQGLYQNALNDTGLLRSSHINQQLPGGQGLWQKFAQDNPNNVWQARDADLNPLDYKVWQKDVDPQLRQQEMDIEQQVDALRAKSSSGTDDDDYKIDWHNRQAAKNMEGKQYQLEQLNELANKNKMSLDDALSGRTGNEEIDYRADKYRQHDDAVTKHIQAAEDLSKGVPGSDREQLNSLLKQHKRVNKVSGHIMMNSGGKVKKFASGGGVDSMDDSPSQIASDAQAQAPQVNVQGVPAPTPVAPLVQPTAPGSPMVDIYDISGHQAVLGSLPVEHVTDAVTSGKYSLPQGQRIPVMSPDGNAMTIDSNEAEEAFNNGYRYASPGDLKNASFSDAGYQLGAAAEGAASAATFGLSTAVEKNLLGVPQEDINARREANPKSYLAGQLAGLVGSGGFGEGAALAKAGEAAKTLAGGAEGAGALSRVAGAAAQGAAETALFQSGDEVSKMIANDPNQTAETALTDIGLSGVLGGAGGAAIGTISPLWKATVGGKLADAIADFKGRLGEHLENPDMVAASGKQAEGFFNNVSSMADEVYGPEGLKAKDIEASMPEASSKMTDQAQTIADNVKGKITKMMAEPTVYPTRLVQRLQGDLDRYLSKVTNPLSNPTDMFNAAQELKQTLQGYAKFDKMVTPVHEAYDFINQAKNMAFDLRNGLEDTGVWGKAAQRQQAINKAFTEFNPALKDFAKRFTTKLADGSVNFDPDKWATFYNQAAKDKGAIKKQVLGSFMDAANKYTKAISDTHANLGLDNPFTPTPTNMLSQMLEKQSTGSKLADAFVKHGLGTASAEGAGAGIGAAVGASMGAPGFGAIIGQRALGPLFKSVLPALSKRFLSNEVNAAGGKAAVDYATAAAKGNDLITKAGKNFFKPGADVLPSVALPSESDKIKLDKQLKAASMDPTSLTKVAGDVGHYMPEHAVAIGAMTGNAVAYLKSQQPPTTQALPLDKPQKPTPLQMAAYQRALTIAEQPLTVLQHAKDGTIIPQDVVALTSMYPALHDRLSQELFNNMSDHLAKGNDIPYKTRMGLSMFMGKPLDSTMTPSSIMAAQPKPPQQQPQTPTTPKSNPKRSMAGLNKLPDQYSTKEQANESKSRDA